MFGFEKEKKSEEKPKGGKKSKYFGYLQLITLFAMLLYALYYLRYGIL